MKRTLVFFLLILLTASCKQEKEVIETSKINTDESYRPNFHFTPRENWMNDPNGMFYLDGTYHLYFQYYPDGNTWGPMHWGHASSQDLLK